MSNQLHLLISNLASAKNESELKSHFMKIAGEIFLAKAWGWKFYGDDFRVIDYEIKGLSNTILQDYEVVGYRYDPLMSYLIQFHAPIHEQLILTSENWQHSIIYQQVFSRYDIEHIAIAPLIGNGNLLGKIYFTRGKNTKPFTKKNISQLTALSLHLSTCLANLRAREENIQKELTQSHFFNCLTKREQQIANLVAKGLKTADLSIELGITQNSVKQALKRIFVKLNVSTRAEMVAKLMQ